MLTETKISGITLDEFYELNTQVYQNCTNLWLSYAYCVAPGMVSFLIFGQPSR